MVIYESTIFVGGKLDIRKARVSLNTLSNWFWSLFTVCNHSSQICPSGSKNLEFGHMGKCFHRGSSTQSFSKTYPTHRLSEPP
ncbi:hypothetical protein GDO81_002692 [Engystomops pustulosus]|uniref:Uncharacterized protein n=1 Tax=Engystomops pustulosus TaxID=76066 RepID=A0AAV7DRE0_ENGPU|nr:hypothetical protein GDO81_002692 [Engystomops pustulosus]